MKKQQAIELFAVKGSAHPVKDLADAIGITSQAISAWPDELTQNNINRIKHVVKLRVEGGDKAIGRKLAKLMK